MTDMISIGQLRQEGRLLFALLDAIDSDDLIVGTQNQMRWKALKTRVNSGASYEDESIESYELLSDLALSRSLKGTWMESRWRTTDARIRAGAYSPSVAGLPSA